MDLHAWLFSNNIVVRIHGSTSRLQVASINPTFVAIAKMMDLHAWLFSNNIVVRIHGSTSRLQVASMDPTSVAIAKMMLGSSPRTLWYVSMGAVASATTARFE
eukprot:583845-Pelagomonas_calceolata.AAC.2